MAMWNDDAIIKMQDAVPCGEGGKGKGVFPAAIYKSRDGNPDRTLKWLEDFNEEFCKHRPEDYYNKFAQLLRSSAWDSEKYNLGNDRLHEWSVMPEDYTWGAKHLYTLNIDGSVSYKKLKELKGKPWEEVQV